MKTFTTATLAAIVALVIGYFVGAGHPAETPPPPPSDWPGQAKTIVSLRQDNARLQAEVANLNADLAKANATNAELAAQRAAPTPPPAPTLAAHGPTLGLARWEVQQAALNNLRQIDAARKQHVFDKGQPAGSITDLVGRLSYIKTVRSVDGEDYSKLSMNPADPLTVTTPDGIEVTFDPMGATTTRPEKPPEVVHAEELTAKLQASITQAVSAYQAANPGKRPPNEQALIPYFATPQQGADFTELLEARKAAGL
jgi:hypothetical protein